MWNHVLKISGWEAAKYNTTGLFLVGGFFIIGGGGGLVGGKRQRDKRWGGWNRFAIAEVLGFRKDYDVFYFYEFCANQKFSDTC